MENNELAVVQTSGLSLKFTDTAIAEMLEQRKQFEKFVKAQLKDKIDFGVLPSTDKPSLWKAGAEKLASLFQLGSRIAKSDRVIELKDNFAMFAVTVELYHIPTGKVIVQCEGIANSQEKKYRERAVYEWSNQARKKVKVRNEQTPIGDVLNTLTKMAQKRAYVGAVIIATKASDFFNHDLAEEDEDFHEANPDFEKNQMAAQKAELDRINAAKAKVTPIEKTVIGQSGSGTFAAASRPVDPREALSKELNEMRKTLNWTPTALTDWLFGQFGKNPAQMTNDEMKTAIYAMKEGKV